MSAKAVWLMDGFCIVLVLFLMVCLFALPSQQQAVLAPPVGVLYRTGAWIMGAGLLFTCLWGKGKAGLLLGIILLICCMTTACVTLFGLMGLTTAWELLWFLHPVLILPGCVFALWNRKKNEASSG